MKKITASLSTATLLLVLAGCGFKLDDKMLSDDSGIWKMKWENHIYIAQFHNDGTVKVSDMNNVLQSKTQSYSIDDNKESYDLTIGDMTLTVDKKDQKDDEFTGKYQEDKVTFTKESSSYLKDLEKKEKIEQEEKAKEEKKAKEQLAQNRKSVFEKMIAAMTPEGLNGEGTIDTENMSVDNFNSENKNLELSSSEVEFDIPNNDHLKNGETVDIRVLDNGNEIYSQKVKISGLTEYAKNTKAIKNLDEVKQLLNKIADKQTKDSGINKKAMFYFPSDGKFAIAYITSKDEFDQFSAADYITEEGLAFKNGKVSVPKFKRDGEDGFTLDNFDTDISDNDEEKVWQQIIKKIKKSGGVEFK